MKTGCTKHTECTGCTKYTRYSGCTTWTISNHQIHHIHHMGVNTNLKTVSCGWQQQQGACVAEKMQAACTWSCCHSLEAVTLTFFLWNENSISCRDPQIHWHVIRLICENYGKIYANPWNINHITDRWILESPLNTSLLLYFHWASLKCTCDDIHLLLLISI